MDTEIQARREAIRLLLRTQVISTQEELGQLLAAKGYQVTQATLSRDLAQLQARRITQPEGGTTYELGESRSSSPENPLAGLRNLVTDVDFNESLVIVLTTPGSASVVALGIDRARLPTVLGSIAGDDTIFVAPRRKTTPAALAKQLQSLWRSKPQ